MDAIRMEALTKRYGDVIAVNGLNLNVRQGELLALLGVNGAGKTTTIKMLACLAQPTGGDAYLGGRSIVREAAEVKRIIAVSPQETAVAPGLSVQENLELMCGAHGFSSEKRARRTNEMLEQLGLKEVFKCRAGKLSGGWQRRLSIAIMKNGRLLLCDTAVQIKRSAGVENFEEAFIHIVKGAEA